MKLLQKIKMSNIIIIILLFIGMMVTVIVMNDFIIAPVLAALMEEGMYDWCGVFSRCASKSQPSFVEYVGFGVYWTNISVTNEIIRIKKAALLGLLTGVGYSALMINYRRRC